MLTKGQEELLIEVVKYKKIVCLHALDQKLTDAFVAIILHLHKELEDIKIFNAKKIILAEHKCSEHGT